MITTDERETDEATVEYDPEAARRELARWLEARRGQA